MLFLQQATKNSMKQRIILKQSLFKLNVVQIIIKNNFKEIFALNIVIQNELSFYKRNKKRTVFFRPDLTQFCLFEELLLACHVILVEKVKVKYIQKFISFSCHLRREKKNVGYYTISKAKVRLVNLISNKVKDSFAVDKVILDYNK